MLFRSLKMSYTFSDKNGGTPTTETKDKEKETKASTSTSEYQPPEKNSLTVVGNKDKADTKITLHSSDKNVTAMMDAMKSVQDGEMPSNAQISYLMTTAKDAIHSSSQEAEKRKGTSEAVQISEDLEVVIDDSMVSSFQHVHCMR